MSEKILNMADELNDNRYSSPEQTLEDCLADIRSGKKSPTKLAVIMLDDSDQWYRTGFYLSKLKASEVVALFEVVKQQFLDMLRGIDNERRDITK